MVKTNMTSGKIDNLIDKLGTYVKNLSESAIKKRGIFTIALSGGSSMEHLSKALLKREIKEAIDWSKWHVFWVDERCLPEVSPQSNYGRAREIFLDHVDIPGKQIHPFKGTSNQDEALAEYEKDLEEVFSEKPVKGFPRFDLIVLGVGEDGHIGSLFPGNPAIDEKEHLALLIEDSPKPPKSRITLTLPVINSAHNIAFVVIGESKASIIREIFNGYNRHILPASKVDPVDGQVEWFLDKGAVSEL